MKKAFVILVSILAVSCSLDETYYNYIEAPTYITDAATAKNVLYGVYRNMSTNDLYGYHLSIIFDMPTDISKVDEASVINGRDVCWNAHTADNSRVLGTWSAAYNVIYNANDFIEKTTAAQPGMTSSDRAVTDLYLAEARSIRALMYFELVRLFGGVTLMTTTEQSRRHPSTFVRSKPEDIYDFVETELEETARIPLGREVRSEPRAQEPSRPGARAVLCGADGLCQRRRGADQGCALSGRRLPRRRRYTSRAAVEIVARRGLRLHRCVGRARWKALLL